jgi:hypothetical protein
MASVLDSVAEAARASRASSDKRKPRRREGDRDQTSSLQDWGETIERNRTEKPVDTDGER